MLGVDEYDELIDTFKEDGAEYEAKQSFPQMILENLNTAGVQQAHKEDKITFTALTPWPGDLLCAKGRYMEGGTEKRAAIFIGPEFGTVQRRRPRGGRCCIRCADCLCLQPTRRTPQSQQAGPRPECWRSA